MGEPPKLRWNGWGIESVDMAVSPKVSVLLQEKLGPGIPQTDYPLVKFIERVPKSRLISHPLVLFDPETRIAHSHGQSLPDWISLRCGTLSRFVDGVAFPASIAQIRELLQHAEDTNAIVIPYGGGTSVVGHLEVPEESRPVLSMSLARFNEMISLDRKSRLATFQAGIRGPEIEAALNPRGFTLGHFPQSFEFSTLGGWVATRSAGQQSLKYGRIEQLFAGAEMITPSGTMSFPPFPASAAGPDLRHICLGSEGRMGIIAHVTVRVAAIAQTDIFYGAFFPDWEHAVEAFRELSGSGISLSMARLSNPLETEVNLTLAGHSRLMGLLEKYLELRKIHKGSMCMCLLGFTGSSRAVGHAKKEAFSIIGRHHGVRAGTVMGKAWKKNRFRAPYLRNTLWNMGYAADTLETAVTWDRVTSTLEKIEKALSEGLTESGERVLVFTHLSHVYPTGSSIYTTFVFRIAPTPEETLLRWQRLKKAASCAIVSAGGTISHQHGVGVDHAPYLSSEKGEMGISMCKTIFSHVDPDGRMNPGKLVK